MTVLKCKAGHTWCSGGDLVKKGVFGRSTWWECPACRGIAPRPQECPTCKKEPGPRCPTKCDEYH